MYPGFAFTFRSGHDGWHLWVVISDPFKDISQVLIVNLSTIRNKSFEDHSCVFEQNEHPWIRNRSFVVFRHAQCKEDRFFNVALSQRVITQEQDFPDYLLDRIRQAALVTQHLKREYIELLREQGFIQ